MLNVCPHCGQYRADKQVDPGRGVVRCPLCAHQAPWRFLPLYLVGGASGAGKSAAALALQRQTDAFVVLDADILWRPEYDRPDDGYRDFFESWLRLAKNIGQGGRPVILFGAGFVVPENLAPCVEARYFSGLHHLALLAEDSTLVTRLSNRPDWRQSSHAAFIQGQLDFNGWCMQQADASAVHGLPVDDRTPAQVAAGILAWAERTAPASPPASPLRG